MTVGTLDQTLLDPVSADAPCGVDLEDSPALSALDATRLFGQSQSPEAPPESDPDDKERERRKEKPPPDWVQIKASAYEALAKSKDLRVLTYLGAAMLRTDGLPAFCETLRVGAAWLESYWPTVYPRIDEDAIARRNALNCFADPMAVVDRVWRMPLVASRQHGRFGLRDIDLATGVVPVGKDDVKPDEKPLLAAFAEMPLDELTALEASVSNGIDALNTIDGRMRGEGGPDVAPDFDPLTAHLVRMKHFLRAQLEVRTGSAPTEAGTENAGGPAAATFAGGAIRSHQDAIRALDAVADFFRRNEPSSPVPMFLERAKRLVAKDFLEVLADIAPEALPAVRAVGGIRESE
jgi:type VI secretion system protein ImpA